MAEFGAEFMAGFGPIQLAVLLTLALAVLIGWWLARPRRDRP